MTCAIPPTEMPDAFADYFTDKIAKIRATFDTADSFGRTVLEDVSPVDELVSFILYQTKRLPKYSGLPA